MFGEDASNLQLSIDPRVTAVLRQHWGFDTLRSHQGTSIAATLAGRDTLTVLPTGGGKSLCFHLPPLITGKLTLVISPLIALMDDQIAGLRLAGISAAAVHSNQSQEQLADARAKLSSGELKILMVSPERLVNLSFIGFLRKLNLGHIAIDEAHCISQWGHDFRPEYRKLRDIRQHLPGVPIGAYTATATPRVQQDICEQLHLQEPAVLIGGFDRPNLTYRILPRVRVVDQVLEALARHRHQHHDCGAIIYCLSRKETEAVAQALELRGIRAEAYHAGLAPAVRSRITQDFRDERLNIVVATVAFGMGIDRSDVRLVVHTCIPKSVEHYQQETGRAGRDGLPAECLLLYSAGDIARYRRMFDESSFTPSSPLPEDDAPEPDPSVPPPAMQAQLDLLEQMHLLASSAKCRHKALVEYFGQRYEKTDCGACDYCLSELAQVPNAHDTARKIISCIVRTEQRFAAAHIVGVLRGQRTEKITSYGHDKLTTFGLLRHLSKEQIAIYINQLIDQGHLVRSPDKWQTITLSSTALSVLKNEVLASLFEPKFIATRSAKEQLATSQAKPLSDDELALFETLRTLRRQLAQERSVPPYVILSDVSLHELCLQKPAKVEDLLEVKGIGQRKLEDFGQELLDAIKEHHALRASVRAS